MRVINLFTIVPFFFLCMSGVQAQESKPECNIGIDTMLLQQCYIKDSLLSVMIDSAMAMFRQDITDEYDMPYHYSIRSEKHGPNAYIRIYANSNFTLVLFEGEREEMYNGPFLTYKGHQIYVDTSDQAILEHIRIDTLKGPYYRYFLYDGNDLQSFCFRNRNTEESVSFYVSDKGTRFKLMKYEFRYWDKL